MRNLPFPIALVSLSVWFGFSLALFHVPIPRYHAISGKTTTAATTVVYLSDDSGVEWYQDDDENEEDFDEEEEDAFRLSPVYDGQINSLSDLVKDRKLRIMEAISADDDDDDARYAGNDSRGYRALKYGDLARDPKGCEQFNTTMHVMDALVSHGVLLVDWTGFGGGAKRIAELWKTAERFFFERAEEEEEGRAAESLMADDAIRGAGYYYSTVDGGAWRVLETRVGTTTPRLERRNLLPVRARDALGEEGTAAMISAFDIVADIAKRVVRVAVAASNLEYGAFAGEDDDDNDDKARSARSDRASNAAALLSNELIDDGKRPYVDDHDDEGTTTVASVGTAGLSSHRLCRCEWRGGKEEGGEEEASVAAAREEMMMMLFGGGAPAQTDASFVTAVPVAAVAGLEVFDEAMGRWYSPELRARAIWEDEQRSLGKDPTLQEEETLDDGSEIPWHARYVALLAGECLQLATRNEIPATVYRVVVGPCSASTGMMRSSMLIGGRPNERFRVDRYLGGTLGHPLLEECNGKTMEEICEAIRRAPSFTV